MNHRLDHDLDQPRVPGSNALRQKESPASPVGGDLLREALKFRSEEGEPLLEEASSDATSETSEKAQTQMPRGYTPGATGAKWLLMEMECD